jgi:hypothetical protein
MQRGKGIEEKCRALAVKPASLKHHLGEYCRYFAIRENDLCCIKGSARSKIGWPATKSLKPAEPTSSRLRTSAIFIPDLWTDVAPRSSTPSDGAARAGGMIEYRSRRQCHSYWLPSPERRAGDHHGMA